MKRVSVKGRSLARCRRGTSAVEFAIVAPVLLFLLFGIVAYGIFFGAVHSVQQLAANSARAAIAGLDLDERRSLVEAHVAATVSGGGLLARDALAVEVAPIEGNETFLKVTVTFDASHLPVWSLYEGLPLPETTIRREAIIRNGGY